MSSRALVLAATAALGCSVPFLSPISETLSERPSQARLAVEVIQGFAGHVIRGRKKSIGYVTIG